MKHLKLVILVIFGLFIMNVSALFSWFDDSWYMWGWGKGKRGEVKKAYLGMEFVWVPGGCYKMGDEFGFGYNNEYPVHEVCVDGFWIGKYEVTFDEYDRFCEETGREKPDDEGRGRGRRPVINVSWHEAKAFAKWYSKKVSMDCRLPTEAEWEYACRSGGKREKFSGTSNEDELYRYSNYYGIKDGYRYTAPVGSYKPNGLGIYDMSGNVWEWCEDIYSSDAYKYHKRRNPIYTGEGSFRVLRGGSWNFLPNFLRCSNRFFYGAKKRDNFVGFRLLCK